MEIHCDTIEQFMDCIEGLVARGIRFRADANFLRIILTGGF
jgi:hypothetical protein